MRTTLTLDEDVAAKLKAEARRTGKPFKAVVNDRLRLAFTSRRPSPPGAPFKVHARDLGHVQPGLSLDNIGELLDRVEGPLHK